MKRSPILITPGAGLMAAATAIAGAVTGRSTHRKPVEEVTRVSNVETVISGTQLYRQDYWKRPSKTEARRGYPHIADKKTLKSMLRARRRTLQGRWNGVGDPKIKLSIKAGAKLLDV